MTKYTEPENPKRKIKVSNTSIHSCRSFVDKRYMLHTYVKNSPTFSTVEQT